MFYLLLARIFEWKWQFWIFQNNCIQYGKCQFKTSTRRVLKSLAIPVMDFIRGVSQCATYVTRADAWPPMTCPQIVCYIAHMNEEDLNFLSAGIIMAAFDGHVAHTKSTTKRSPRLGSFPATRTTTKKSNSVAIPPPSGAIVWLKYSAFC